MKKILITGASGYIGKNLIEYLSDQYVLYTPAHKELDLLDTSAVGAYLSKHPVDIVIHAALIGGSRQEEYINSMLFANLRMFFNLVRNKKYFKKIIHFGSGAEYDKSRPIVNVTENDFDKNIPVDEYGFYKYVCSKYIEKSENIVNLRIFGMFGKYEDYRYRFISNAICRNLAGLPITLRQDVYFDYVSIQDFVKIVAYFIRHDTKEKFYNIGTGKKIRLSGVAQKIHNLSEKKSEILIQTKGLQNEYTCNNARLMNELKDFTFADFDNELQELYQWYKIHMPSINIQSL